jgi:hypothetical protein
VDSGRWRRWSSCRPKSRTEQEGSSRFVALYTEADELRSFNYGHVLTVASFILAGAGAYAARAARRRRARGEDRGQSPAARERPGTIGKAGREAGSRSNGGLIAWSSHRSTAEDSYAASSISSSWTRAEVRGEITQAAGRPRDPVAVDQDRHPNAPVVSQTKRTLRNVDTSKKLRVWLLFWPKLKEICHSAELRKRTSFHLPH